MLKPKRKPGICLGKKAAAQLRMDLTVFQEFLHQTWVPHLKPVMFECYKNSFFHSIIFIWIKVQKMFEDKNVKAKPQKYF